MLRKNFEILFIFLRLGLTSFGGPIAHLGYFHDEFVKRRKWLDEHSYADLVALCQFLPGPASSQVGMCIGLNRTGIWGAVLAWVGFTLPSAMALVLFAFGISFYHVNLQAGWLHSLKVAAVAIVAQALWAMGPKLCPDKERIGIAILACLVTLLFPSAWTQLTVIFIGGFFGIVAIKKTAQLPHSAIPIKVSNSKAVLSLVVFGLLLLGLPLIAQKSEMQTLKIVDSFYRVGSLVFGGGHVVLPLLQSEVVPSGWMSNDVFMAGYGAAQAIPGPLFSFSAYLGAISNLPPAGWTGATICLVAIFLPSFLLIVGVLPFWEKLRKITAARQGMSGINAAVVGLLLAAFYNPVLKSGILNMKDFSLALIAFILLTFYNAPSWAIVIGCGIIGAVFL